MSYEIIFAALSILLAFIIFLLLRHTKELRIELETIRNRVVTLEYRKRELKQQEQRRLETLFDSMAEGIIILDDADKIQFINNSAVRLFNLQQSARGRTIMEALRMHQIQEIVDKARKEENVLGFEFEPPELHQCILQLNATALKSPGDTKTGVILVFHDLSRIKQLENTRKEFVANVSHELRTPLSLIKGYVETLLSGAKDEPPIAARFLQIIQKHADRLTFLIEDLLTISRLESGPVILNRSPASLHAMTTHVIDDMNSSITDKTFTIENRVPTGLSANIDSDRFEQVLSNLVDNAIKYGQNGVRIVISGHYTNNKFVELEVSDNGPGIPEDALERIFERFYRVDRGRSREQGGTGLGLSIVKHIVQSHGGRVHAQSKLGHGTTFFITVPVDQSPPA
ncbi:MAG: PAS domain-containing protein [Verrucomicrobia bacterium]|nr:PAS domain-containing protein [Verrucomicrobiota bacterium]MCF7708376.1 PAS domain-containing protein [Verrucomicrobiota bacterium]